MTGKINYLAPDGKTFGFIRPVGARSREEHVFFAGPHLANCEWQDLFVGASVDFELGDEDPKGLRAASVALNR